MRLAYITETYPPELNGVALTVHRTVEFLRAKGHEVGLIRPRQPGEARVDDASEWRTAGLPIPNYPELRFGLARVSMLRKRFERTRPSLVHIATQGPLGWAAARAARACGLPVTTDFRTNFHQYGSYYRLGWLEPAIAAYLRSFHNAARATFVPTEELRADLAALGFERLHVVGRGVDTSLFGPEHRDAALRAEWGASSDAPDAPGAPMDAPLIAPVMLYVGRLAAEKNVPLALRAFEAVRASQPATRMVVVGDGPLKAELQSRHPDASFLGVLRGEMLARCYASADLFAFPSMSETFGNVVVEALASGLAVVAFNTAAAGELIANDVSGLLVEPGDDNAFIVATQQMAALFEDTSGWQALMRLRIRAREVALGTGWESVLERFVLQLEQVCVSAYANKDNHDRQPPVAERPL